MNFSRYFPLFYKYAPTKMFRSKIESFPKIGLFFLIFQRTRCHFLLWNELEHAPNELFNLYRCEFCSMVWIWTQGVDFSLYIRIFLKCKPWMLRKCGGCRITYEFWEDYIIYISPLLYTYYTWIISAYYIYSSITQFY